MRITELIKALGRADIHCPQDFVVSGVSSDSRSVSHNFVFVAVNGASINGNDFIHQAIAKGARAIITEEPLPKFLSPDVSFIRVKDARIALARLSAEFWSHPCDKIKVVGITGTNGKTTVSYLIEAILKQARRHPAVIGTINYRFGGKVILAKNTTPGPVEIQSMLANMLKSGVDYALMEVSSHALDQNRVAGIDFHSAIFTNLTQDHLDYHRTKANYFKAKAKLFKNIRPHSPAILNSDDRYSRALKRITAAKVITYGISHPADLRAEKIKFNYDCTEFRLSKGKQKLSLKTHLIGRHNLYNVLAAIAWAIEEGISLSAIKSGLEEPCVVPGRLEKVSAKEKFLVFVDYAHTEDGLKNVIGALRGLCSGKIIVVFGCGGERDRTKRPKMGKTVTEMSDYAIITNDNPRSEEPQSIINDIIKGIKNNNYCVIFDRKEAISKSFSLAGPGDIVLIAGKGHEGYQVIKDKMIAFDDREVARECLRSMKS
jgi:UDP-N-acetylmuramoyl-L-alanyl-D-glutamate--2,6-diaminopimelate ligase